MGGGCASWWARVVDKRDMAWIESFATDLHIGRHYWTWQRLFFRTQWRSQFRSQTVCQTRSCKCTWRQRQRWQSVCNLTNSEDKLIDSYHLAVGGYSTDTSCIQFAYIHLKIPTIFQHIYQRMHAAYQTPNIRPVLPVQR